MSSSDLDIISYRENHLLLQYLLYYYCSILRNPPPTPFANDDSELIAKNYNHRYQTGTGLGTGSDQLKPEAKENYPSI
ncbi:hypothetical protein EAE96_008987 [Botrytis aclada]|nr:hypothetical protein EAE96_008987 [Botrytis aclada]